MSTPDRSPDPVPIPSRTRLLKRPIKLATRDGSAPYAIAEILGPDGCFGIHPYQYGVTLTHVPTGLRLTNVIAKPRHRARVIARRIAAELEQIAIAAEVETPGGWSANPIPRELLKQTAGVIIRIMKEEGIWA